MPLLAFCCPGLLRPLRFLAYAVGDHLHQPCFSPAICCFRLLKRLSSSLDGICCCNKSSARRRCSIFRAEIRSAYLQRKPKLKAAYPFTGQEAGQQWNSAKMATLHAVLRNTSRLALCRYRVSAELPLVLDYC